jgi:hypothetical protein
MGYSLDDVRNAHASSYSPLSEAARLRREHREALRAIQTLAASQGNGSSGNCSAAAVSRLKEIEAEMRGAGIEVPHPLQVLWR